MAHDQQILRGRGALLHTVDERRENVLIGGMRQDFACLTYRHPHDIVDFAYVRAMHRAECVDEMFGVLSGDGPCHPVQRVLGVDGAVVRMAGLLAFLRQRVFDLAQVRTERDAYARLLADFANRRMTV